MSEIFYTDSASFQTFEVTSKAIFNNITVSGSLSFSGSYSLPFAICEIPFLNKTDQNTYSAGVENYIELDPTFNINSGEFSATNRFISGSLEISKTGYYSIYASITLNFASNPDDVVTVKIYDHAANKPISTAVQLILDNIVNSLNMSNLSFENMNTSLDTYVKKTTYEHSDIDYYNLRLSSQQCEGIIFHLMPIELNQLVFYHLKC